MKTITSNRYSCVQFEALAFLRSLPTDSVDLVLFSPPYEDARQYGELKFKLRGEAWVQWLRPIVVESARVSRGLVLVNAAGKVRDWKYSPIIEMLTADLVRIDGLTCGPAPYAWTKNAGIPGSGSTKYQRRDWEPVYAYADPAKLPLKWSDNTAFGHAPKWGPGGEMSHRLSNGKRANHGRSAQCGSADGDYQKGLGYTVPRLANHGNVIRTKVGGGHLGHRLSTGNEAPYPVALAERFVCWFVPPDGVVLDPFSGSGTTGHAALIHGRRFLGCDLRADQVELTLQRLVEVSSSQFA
jgi:hypothetical protein